MTSSTMPGIDLDAHAVGWTKPALLDEHRKSRTDCLAGLAPALEIGLECLPVERGKELVEQAWESPELCSISSPSASSGRRYGISSTEMAFFLRTSLASRPSLCATASMSRSRTNVVSKRAGAR